MSDHSVEVVRIKLDPHPNADKLSIVKVHGYQVIVRTEDWKDGDLAAYIPPDSVVPDKIEYAFLDGHLRIKARRFRGLWSFGLLMPAPKGSKVGDNVATIMGVIHYEPPLKGRGMTENAADFAKPPELPGPIYDVENILRYDEEFTPEIKVVVTEKLHGANIRMTFQHEKFHVASRRFYRKEFRRPTAKSLWDKIRLWFIEYIGNQSVEVPSNSEYWNAFNANEELRNIVKANAGFVFYGELYGSTQGGFTYDVEEGNKIRIFDILDPRTRTYLPWREVSSIVPGNLLVPVDAIGSFDLEKIKWIAESPSHLTDKHIREGVVVKPLEDMYSNKIGGRLILKYVNPNYLEKS